MVSGEDFPNQSNGPDFGAPLPSAEDASGSHQRLEQPPGLRFR